MSRVVGVVCRAVVDLECDRVAGTDGCTAGVLLVEEEVLVEEVLGSGVEVTNTLVDLGLVTDLVGVVGSSSIFSRS